MTATLSNRLAANAATTIPRVKWYFMIRASATRRGFAVGGPTASL